MASARRPILKLGVVDIGVENAQLPNGVTIDLAVIRHPGASAIVALDADGTVTMLTQYRHAIGGWLREIPAGCRDGDETPLQCAQRELREEAAIVAQRWDHLGSIVTIPSFCDERIDLYLARELSVAAGQLDDDEVIRVEKIALERALAMVSQGEIIDAKTIAALYRANAFLRDRRD
ncbi:MAG TPA: NUDIX hydrolase [Candidatus Binataceae bacterium]|nr:NUDIX hydrolase [Candidatus Binataceae bacterium]